MAEQGGAWMPDEEDDSSSISGAQQLMQQLMGAGQPQMTPEERAQMAAMSGELRERIGKRLNKQELQTEQMKESLNKYRSEPQELDLSPLAGWVDYLNDGKTKVLDSYMKMGTPESRKQKNANIRGMEDAISKAEDRLTKSEINALKTSMNSMKSTMSPAATARIYGTKERIKQQEKTRKKGLEKDLRGDIKKTLSLATKDNEMFQKLTKNIAGGNIREVYMTLGSFVRNIGEEKGALSEGDVRRAMYEDLETKINKALTWFGADGTTISKANMQAVRNVLEAAKTASLEAHGAELKNQRSLYDVGGGSYNKYFQKGQFADNMFINANVRLGKIFTVPIKRAPGTERVGAKMSTMEQKKKRFEELKAKAAKGK